MRVRVRVRVLTLTLTLNPNPNQAAVGDTHMGGATNVASTPGRARSGSSDGSSYPRVESMGSDPSRPTRTTRRLVQLGWAAAAESVAAGGLGAAHLTLPLSLMLTLALTLTLTRPADDDTLRAELNDFVQQGLLAQEQADAVMEAKNRPMFCLSAMSATLRKARCSSLVISPP